MIIADSPLKIKLLESLLNVKDVGIWWRDDDLECMNDSVSCMARIAENYRMKPLVAIIPKSFEENLSDELLDVAGRFCIAQHGFQHKDHGQRSEFGASRNFEEATREIETGLQIVKKHLGAHAPFCFVPPWNSVANKFLPFLNSLGFSGLSTFCPYPAYSNVRNFMRLDVQIDLNFLIKRDFSDVIALFEQTMISQIEYLESKELSLPIGLMTHHHHLNKADWDNIDRLFNYVTNYLGMELICSSDIFNFAGKKLWPRSK